MEKILSLIMEVLLNGTELKDAFTDLYGIEASDLPTLTPDQSFEDKGKAIFTFLKDNKDALKISSDVFNINIDEIMTIIQKLGSDSDNWNDPDDVFESINKLGLAANMEFNSEIENLIFDTPKLKNYVEQGINEVVKKAPIMYRPILKNKIKNKLGGNLEYGQKESN